MILKPAHWILTPKSACKGDIHAQASREALRAYAEAIKAHNKELAEHLINWADCEEIYSESYISLLMEDHNDRPT